MSNPRINSNAPKTILKSLSELKNSKGNELSFEALTLYSHFYSVHPLFYQNFNVTHEEIASVINCKKTKCYKLIAELVEFNLIKKCCPTAIDGICQLPNILSIFLLPPPPFVFLRATVRILNFSGNIIPVKNVHLIAEDSQELILKHDFIYLGDNHLYKELLKELDIGEVIYFVAAHLSQLEDGRWELGKIFNLMTTEKVREKYHG